MPCGSLSLSCCLSYQRYHTYQIVFKTDPMWPNPTKILLECSLDLPKSFQNPPRIDPMEHQKASWGPLWTPHGTKHHFEHQKNAQVAPRTRGENGENITSNFNVFSTFVSTLFLKRFCPTFWRLSTSKIWFSSRRNANFHKIEVLEKSTRKSQHSGPFFDPKSKEIPSKKRD